MYITRQKCQFEKATYCIIQPKVKLGESKKSRGFQGLGGGGLGRSGGGRDELVEHRGFLDRDTTLYDTVIVDTCHHTLIKTNRMYNTKNVP